jgi:DNA-binding MarR family transcriptional regulator
MAAWSGFLWTHAHVLRVLDVELEQDHGMSLSAFDVLYQLSIAVDQRLHMSQLAEAVLVATTGLADIVEKLASGGLVEREQTDGDAGDAYIRITDRGLEVLARVTPTHIDGIKKDFFAHLSEEQTEQLAVVLQTLKMSLRRS